MMVVISALTAYAQPQIGDWAKFGRYEEANKEVSVRPKAVFMGDSITDFWVENDPDFFTDNNFIGRGISGQASAHMLVRFRRDVIDHHPKYVVILAGTNDVAKNLGVISHENTLGNIISMCELARANKIRPIICSGRERPGKGDHQAQRPPEGIRQVCKDPICRLPFCNEG